MLISNKMLILYMVTASVVTTYAYDDCFVPTGLDTRWKRRCKRRQFISSLDSVFKGSYNDRIWKICCRNLPLPDDLVPSVRCSNWTGFVNTYGGVMDFECPNNGYIAGIRSKHSNEREDRVFRFKCCTITGVLMENCKPSGFVNGFNQRATYTVPQDRVLNGMGSLFRGHYKDRLFEFQDCIMKKRT